MCPHARSLTTSTCRRDGTCTWTRPVDDQAVPLPTQDLSQRSTADAPGFILENNRRSAQSSYPSDAGNWLQAQEDTDIPKNYAPFSPLSTPPAAMSSLLATPDSNNLQLRTEESVNAMSPNSTISAKHLSRSLALNDSKNTNSPGINGN
jgi:hypothetical protein